MSGILKTDKILSLPLISFRLLACFSAFVIFRMADVTGAHILHTPNRSFSSFQTFDFKMIISNHMAILSCFSLPISIIALPFLPLSYVFARRFRSHSLNLSLFVRSLLFSSTTIISNAWKIHFRFRLISTF